MHELEGNTKPFAQFVSNRVVPQDSRKFSTVKVVVTLCRNSLRIRRQNRCDHDPQQLQHLWDLLQKFNSFQITVMELGLLSHLLPFDVTESKVHQFHAAIN